MAAIETLRKYSHAVLKVGTAGFLTLGSAFSGPSADQLRPPSIFESARILQAVLREKEDILKGKQPEEKGRNRLNGHPEDGFAVTPWMF